eukprot:13715192-Ditylum_brightwellii.AAC.1
MSVVWHGRRGLEFVLSCLQNDNAPLAQELYDYSSCVAVVLMYHIQRHACGTVTMPCFSAERAALLQLYSYMSSFAAGDDCADALKGEHCSVPALDVKRHGALSTHSDISRCHKATLAIPSYSCHAKGMVSSLALQPFGTTTMTFLSQS